MNKEIVIVVPTEVAAYEVVKALKGLDAEGSIELYASNVVVKTPSGGITIKDKEHIRGPWGTLLGASTGALIGLLAGPVGAAVGAAVGGAAGLGGDLAYSGFVGDFVQDVAARLAPGGHAVVASVWEDWTVPVDVAVAPFAVGGVFRQSTDDIVTAQIRSELQTMKEEAQHLDAEISRRTARSARGSRPSAPSCARRWPHRRSDCTSARPSSRSAGTPRSRASRRRPPRQRPRPRPATSSTRRSSPASRRPRRPRSTISSRDSHRGSMVPVRDHLPTRSFPVVNYALIALNVVVFGFEAWLAAGNIEPTGLEWALVPDQIVAVAIGRLVSGKDRRSNGTRLVWALR